MRDHRHPAGGSFGCFGDKVGKVFKSSSVVAAISFIVARKPQLLYENMNNWISA